MTGKLPQIFRRLFANQGAGPLLREDIVPYPDRNKYNLCEFYYFRCVRLRSGFQPAQGGLLENAARLYPEAWAYLQTEEGREMCLTEAEWQAMTRTNWATLADGSTVGWNGIGGAPFYAPHSDTGALRLPDLRGMYAEASGFDSLEVGGVHGDAIRNVKDTGGSIHGLPLTFVSVDGSQVPPLPFVTRVANPSYSVQELLSSVNRDLKLGFDAGTLVPTAAKNQPRAWGALACVYLGAPK